MTKWNSIYVDFFYLRYNKQPDEWIYGFEIDNNKDSFFWANIFYPIKDWKKWRFNLQNYGKKKVSLKKQQKSAGNVNLETRSIRFETSIFGLKYFAKRNFDMNDFFLGYPAASNLRDGPSLARIWCPASPPGSGGGHMHSWICSCNPFPSFFCFSFRINSCLP